MTDYISRETATKYPVFVDLGDWKGKVVPVDFIEAIPAADVRPVVLCRNCDFWDKQKDSAQGRCALHRSYPTGAWFCADGKPKEQQEEENA